MLVSRLLSGDARLRKCAIEHPSHVQFGDKGPYVKLIQLALLIAGDKDIDDKELAASSFGASTRDAVLDFKTKRQIINYSYQKSPDPIVGIMTIKRLDAEIAAKEIANIPAAMAPGGEARTKRS